MIALIFLICYQGNIKLSMSEDGIEIGKDAAAQHVSRLLSVTHDELVAALTERVIAARGEIMQKVLTLEQAEFVRDALAKVCIKI